MKAYIKNIDITTDGRVVVSGELPSTNLKAQLSAHIYIEPPQDGIWGYTLEVIPTSLIGATVMVPFSVEAPYTGNEDANGVRILQPSLHPKEDDHETVQLKAKKVKSFTEQQANFIMLEGAWYDSTAKQLIVDIRYSGGCFSHLFALEWDGRTLESNPPQYLFNLVDLSEYDPCKAIISAQLRFDVDVPEVQLEKPATIHLETPKGGRQIQVDI